MSYQLQLGGSFGRSQLAIVLAAIFVALAKRTKKKRIHHSTAQERLKKPIEKNIPVIRENSSISNQNNYDYHDIS